jgi:excisionase family DNA binding protein
MFAVTASEKSYSNDAKSRGPEHTESKFALSVKEAAKVSSLSRAFIYAEWQSGRGPAKIKAGNRTLILAETLWEWLRSLEAKPETITSAPCERAAVSIQEVENTSTAPLSPRRAEPATSLANALTSERNDVHRRRESNVPFLQRLTCTINDACAATGLGRTKLYELIGEGLIETTRAGRRRLILVSSLNKCFPAR